MIGHLLSARKFCRAFQAVCPRILTPDLREAGAQLVLGSPDAEPEPERALCQGTGKSLGKGRARPHPQRSLDLEKRGLGRVPRSSQGLPWQVAMGGVWLLPSSEMQLPSAQGDAEGHGHGHQWVHQLSQRC